MITKGVGLMIVAGEEGVSHLTRPSYFDDGAAALRAAALAL